MVKIILAALLMTGCATDNSVNKKVDLLSERMIRLDYYLSHEKCFISYNTCRVNKKKNCWKNHERCVIKVWKHYSPLMKIK